VSPGLSPFSQSRIDQGFAMDEGLSTIIAFLETVHPYDGLPQDELARVAGSFSRREYGAGEEVYHAGEPLRACTW
jgi:CBS domain-containing protein